MDKISNVQVYIGAGTVAKIAFITALVNMGIVTVLLIPYVLLIMSIKP